MNLSRQTKAFFALGLITGAFSAAPALSAPETGAVVVRVSGFKHPEGKVKISLHNTPENFKDKSHPFRWQEGSVSGDTREFVFDNLPFGDYAVRLFHDENSNNRIDFNLFGYPKEAFGFSNNAKPFLGIPPFKKAKFALNQKTLIVNIALQ